MSAAEATGPTPAEAELTLVRAVEAGDLETVRQVVRSKVLSAEKLASNTFSGPSDFRGESLLHIAVWFGHMEVAKFLIDSANADVNLPSRMEHVRPLHIACRQGLVLVSKLLLSFHADLNAQQNNKHTPLHLATLSGNVDLVKYLVNLGARLDIEGSDGKTPLGLAQKHEFRDIIRVLTEAEREAGIFTGSTAASTEASHSQTQGLRSTANSSTVGGGSSMSMSGTSRSIHRPLQTTVHTHAPLGWRSENGAAEYQPIRALIVRQATEDGRDTTGRLWGTKKPPYAQHDCTQVPIDDEDLRVEFAKLDPKGRGWVLKSQFKELYNSMEHYGSEEMERASIDSLLSGFNMLGQDRLAYEEFAVIMLRLAQR